MVMVDTVDWLPEALMARVAPNWHYEHVLRDVVPALLERGTGPEQITAMLVDNPRRYFEGPDPARASA